MNPQAPVPAASEEAVRAALDRVTGSAGFRSSPHLAAFLRVTVEMALRALRSGDLLVVQPDDLFSIRTAGGGG